MKKKQIAVITGSRADYGLLYWVMKEIKRHKTLQLLTIVTGQHLLRKAGMTVNDIIRDGFYKVHKINMLGADTTPAGIAGSISAGINGFSRFFSKQKPDIMLVLGDRYEIFAAAIAALPFNIPIGHIGGGEISEGSIDDNIRHCLTKLSHLHFAITKECASRIHSMGEEQWRIRVVGSPRLDFLYKVKFSSKAELRVKFGIQFKKKTVLFIFHPSTLEITKTSQQIKIALSALAAIDAEKIIIRPNVDTHSNIINKHIDNIACRHPETKVFTSLERNDYLSILNSVDIMVGNSSSGLIEGPSFKLAVVNIGNRQKGRDCLKNVIQVGYSTAKIIQAIKKGLYDSKFRFGLKKLRNPYGDGKAAKRIVDTLLKTDFTSFSLQKKNSFDRKA